MNFKLNDIKLVRDVWEYIVLFNLFCFYYQRRVIYLNVKDIFGKKKKFDF